MYNATKFNYVIEGRVNNQSFKATAFKLAEVAGGPGYQFQVDIRLKGTVLVGIDSKRDPFDVLRGAVNRVFGPNTL